MRMKLVVEHGFHHSDRLFSQTLTAQRGRDSRAAHACSASTLLLKYTQPSAASVCLFVLVADAWVVSITVVDSPVSDAQVVTTAEGKQM